MFWLGIDIGTGGSRALLIDEKGKVLHSFTAPHEDMRMERPMWAEQRPENWWDASQAAIRGVLKQAKASGQEVAGIGLSGQMHGLTLLDEADNVIRPALIWCDQRSQAQVDWINRTATRGTVLECIANPVLTGFTLPKLLWVRDNEPELYARVKKVLLPAVEKAVKATKTRIDALGNLCEYKTPAEVVKITEEEYKRASEIAKKMGLRK